MKMAKATETGAIKIVPIKNIKPNRARITVCPAIMFAKRRIQRANGSIKMTNFRVIEAIKAEKAKS